MRVLKNAQTHVLEVFLSRPLQPYPLAVIERLRDYVHGAYHDHKGITLIWNAVVMQTLYCRFVTVSPYSDALTSDHGKWVIGQALSFATPALGGRAVQLSFMVTSVQLEGTYIHANGVTSVPCPHGHEACHRHPQRHPPHPPHPQYQQASDGQQQQEDERHHQQQQQQQQQHQSFLMQMQLPMTTTTTTEMPLEMSPKSKKRARTTKNATSAADPETTDNDPPSSFLFNGSCLERSESNESLFASEHYHPWQI